MKACLKPSHLLKFKWLWWRHVKGNEGETAAPAQSSDVSQHHRKVFGESVVTTEATK